MKDCVVEKFSVRGEGAEGGGCGVREDVFDDDERVGPEECVEDVLWDESIGAECEPGEEEERGVHDEAADSEKDPLMANEGARCCVAEACDGNAVEDPGDSEGVEMEERFAGADEHADGVKAKEAREESVAGFVRDGEWILQKQDQEDDRHGGELECAAPVAGANADEHDERDRDCENDVNTFVKAAVTIRAIVFGAAEGEAFLGEGLSVERVDAADVAVCGDGPSIPIRRVEKRAEFAQVSKRRGARGGMKMEAGISPGIPV